MPSFTYPAGSSTEVQYRHGTTGDFAAIAGSAWDGTTATFPSVAIVSGTLTIDNNQAFRGKNAAAATGTLIAVDVGNNVVFRNPFDASAYYGVLATGTGHAYIQTQGANRVDVDENGIVIFGRGTSGAEIRMLEPSGPSYVSLLSPARAANLNLTFPAGLPTVNQVLQAAAVTGSDVTLGWATAGSGSVATDTIWNVKGDLAVGTGSDTAARLAPSTNGFILSLDSAEATGLKWISAPGGGDMLLGTVQVVTALKTFGAAGAVSKFALAGTTSGSTVLDASAVASGTLTLPAATDTLVARATTDTLTGKTYDTAGAGNSFLINGLAATANTGTGAVVRATSPTLTTPVLGVATATSVTVDNTGLHVLDTDASHDLILKPGSNLTVDRTLTITTGDADRTLTIDASATLNGGTHSGTNTGDVTLAGTPDYITISGQVITRAKLDIADDLNTFTSAALATLCTDETGSGLLVFATSPTLTTPTLGVATATTINKVTLTAPATGSTLTIAEGKTLTASNTITFTATDGSTLAIGTGGTLGTAAYTASSAYQPIDATLTAFAALTIAAESLTIGTGADAFTQVTFAANTFPARASTGSLVAKTVSDAALTVLDDASVSAMVDTLGGASSTGTGGLVRSVAPTLTGRAKTTATYQDIVADVDGATITFDLSAGNLHSVTLGGNRTLALSNAQTGQVFSLRLLQDATGSRTVTWFATIKWAGGAAPTLTTTASKWDWLGFICTGTNTYDGFVLGANG